MAALQAILLTLAATGGGDTALLDFYSDTCPPCRQMAPAIDQLAARGYPIRKVNVAREPDLAARFHVGPIPCFVMVVDGREADRVVGPTNAARLEQMLALADRGRAGPAGADPIGRAGTLRSGALGHPRRAKHRAVLRFRRGSGPRGCFPQPNERGPGSVAAVDQPGLGRRFRRVQRTVRPPGSGDGPAADQGCPRVVLRLRDDHRRPQRRGVDSHLRPPVPRFPRQRADRGGPVRSNARRANPRASGPLQPGAGRRAGEHIHLEPGERGPGGPARLSDRQGGQGDPRGLQQRRGADAPQRPRHLVEPVCRSPEPRGLGAPGPREERGRAFHGGRTLDRSLQCGDSQRQRRALRGPGGDSRGTR